jgi:Mycothiol maleylpyruvate isomerase N-terminal domain
MDGKDVLEAAGACQALLGAAADRDWTRPIPEMDWTVAKAVTHMAEGTLWYATDLAAGTERQDTMELRVPPETAPAELVRAIGTFATVLARVIDATPPAGLVRATRDRLFPWAPATPDPWSSLLWANGRIALGGHPRQTRWRWHCAPLEEWDGLNPADPAAAGRDGGG